jgi:hypothetical protein
LNVPFEGFLFPMKAFCSLETLLVPDKSFLFSIMRDFAKGKIPVIHGGAVAQRECSLGMGRGGGADPSARGTVALSAQPRPSRALTLEAGLLYFL